MHRTVPDKAEDGAGPGQQGLCAAWRRLHRLVHPGATATFKQSSDVVRFPFLKKCLAVYAMKMDLEETSLDTLHWCMKEIVHARVRG